MPVHSTLPKLLLLLVVSILLASCAQQRARVDGSKLPSGDCYLQIIKEGQQHYFNRHHGKAIALYEKAGRIKPDQPEWEFEMARALFAMDRYSESADACSRVLERFPAFYEALGLQWAARLELENASNEIQNAVRREIESLLALHDAELGALLAAHDGFEFLDDDSARRLVMYKLAARSDEAEQEIRYDIGSRLFEEIIQARDDREQQIRLMEAYIDHFPERRFADYIAYRMLQKKQETAPPPADPSLLITPLLESRPKSPRINIGVARWLIEEECLPEQACELIRESLEIRRHAPEDKPPYFTDDLWQDTLDKETDYWRYLLGRALYQSGQFKAAEAELLMVAAKKRNWSGVYHYLGEIAAKQNEIDGAIHYFRQALESEERTEDSLPRLKQLLAQRENHHDDPALFFSRQSASIYFSDITESAGLGGISAKRVAWGDYNNDGFADILLDGRYLFENSGDGRFQDVSDDVGLDGRQKSRGGIWIDYDNDGDLDIYATAWGVNRLLENIDGRYFTDVTDAAFPVPLTDARTEAAAWGDMDNDGYPDLYAANYERKGVMRALGTQDRLFRNNADGTFSDISHAAGIVTEEAMCGRGVTWSDVNRDGFQDIVVANYRLEPNFLWINHAGTRFMDLSGSFGTRGYMTQGAFGHSIGPVTGDLDNDGLADLFISNLAHPRYIQYSDQNMLLMNQGPPTYHFRDRYDASGIAFEETNSDPALADVDNDGDLDLYMTSIYPGRYSHLYLSDGGGRFTDASWMTRTRVENSWGAAFADFNNDGYPDLLVASDDGVHLFQNTGGHNHWLKIIVTDHRCNRSGIGSIITAAYAQHRQEREIAAGRGTGNQDGQAVIFGLGNHDGPVTISVRTLCGDLVTKTIDQPDQIIPISIP